MALQRATTLLLLLSAAMTVEAQADDGDTASARARALVAQMTLAEKESLLRGTRYSLPGYYVGNIPPIARLGVPPLNMQDNGNGFRTTDTRMVGGGGALFSPLTLTRETRSRRM